MGICVITVDLDCCRCKAKITKVLDCLKGEFSIEKVEFDDKNKKVVVRGKYDAEKLCKAVWCKAGKIVKEIIIVEVWPVPPPPKKCEPPCKPQHKWKCGCDHCKHDCKANCGCGSEHCKPKPKMDTKKEEKPKPPVEYKLVPYPYPCPSWPYRCPPHQQCHQCCENPPPHQQCCEWQCCEKPQPHQQCHQCCEWQCCEQPKPCSCSSHGSCGCSGAPPCWPPQPPVCPPPWPGCTFVTTPDENQCSII